MYVDGLPLTSIVSTGDVNAVNTAVNIGARNTGASLFFNGILDDIMILPYSLSASQVQSLYQSGLTGHPELLRRVGTTSYFTVSSGNRRRRVICAGVR